MSIVRGTGRCFSVGITFVYRWYFDRRDGQFPAVSLSRGIAVAMQHDGLVCNVGS